MESGDKTFTMTLRRPTIAYETLFQWILPHHAIEETTFPDDWVDELWPSGGPFIIDTIDTDTSITAVRNERYWKVDPDTGLGLPYLDSVEFRFIPETEEIIRAFQAREVDVIQPSPSLEFSIRPIMSLEADGAVLEVRSGPVWEHVNFQFGPGRLERSPDSCNENLALRRAVMHAIDRDAAVEDIYGGFVEAATSWLDAYTPSLSSGAWDRYPHDPARAAELYAQAVAETGRNVPSCSRRPPTPRCGHASPICTSTCSPKRESRSRSICSTPSSSSVRSSMTACGISGSGHGSAHQGSRGSSPPTRCSTHRPPHPTA
jgi:ABC-type transport system substrate-binding protein